MTAIQKRWIYLIISAIVFTPMLESDADDQPPTPKISAEDARYMMEIHLDVLESRRKAAALAEQVKRNIEARKKRIERFRKAQQKPSFLL